MSVNSLQARQVPGAAILEDSKMGYVLELDGQGYLDCGNSLAYEITGPLTVAAWVKAETLNQRISSIVTKGDSAWQLRCNSRGMIEFVGTGLHVPDSMWCIVTGEKTVSDKKWHHVVGVYDSTGLSVYFDGELDTSRPASGTINTNRHDVYIGANSEMEGRTWVGLIDGVRIYNYALSEAEIKSLHSAREPDGTRR